MKNHIKKTSGFTIIELMLAIILLGGMLTLIMVVIVGMLRFYAFANTVRKNQANGREVLDLIGRDLRFGNVLTPSGDTVLTSGDVICVYNRIDRKIIVYRYETSQIKRFLYNWTINTPPVNCVNTQEAAPPNSPYSFVESKTISQPSMKVTKFDVVRVRGAKYVVFNDASSIVINFSFLTGNPSVSDSNRCDARNIFCNRLDYNTALNFRSSIDSTNITTGE